MQACSEMSPKVLLDYTQRKLKSRNLLGFCTKVEVGKSLSGLADCAIKYGRGIESCSIIIDEKIAENVQKKIPAIFNRVLGDIVLRFLVSHEIEHVAIAKSLACSSEQYRSHEWILALNFLNIMNNRELISLCHDKTIEEYYANIRASIVILRDERKNPEIEKFNMLIALFIINGYSKIKYQGLHIGSPVSSLKTLRMIRNEVITSDLDFDYIEKLMNIQDGDIRDLLYGRNINDSVIEATHSVLSGKVKTKNIYHYLKRFF